MEVRDDVYEAGDFTNLLPSAVHLFDCAVMSPILLTAIQNPH